MPTTLTCPSLQGEINITAATVVMGASGAWSLRLTADGEKALPIDEDISVDLEELTLVGRSESDSGGAFQGRISAKILPGNASLAKVLPSIYYDAGVTLRNIVSDVMRETGARLDPKSDSTLLDYQFPKWERVEGPAGHALTEAAQASGGNWTANLDGKILILKVEYPDVDPEETLGAQLMDIDYFNGFFLFGSGMRIVPGFTYLGRKVTEIEHQITAGKLRTKAWFKSWRGTLESLNAPIKQRINLTTSYQCTVKADNGDGTVALAPLDKRVAGLGGTGGLDHVPLWIGVPGVTLKIKSGCPVLLSFFDGKASAPYAIMHPQGSAEFLETWKHESNEGCKIEFDAAGNVNIEPGGSGKINLGGDALKVAVSEQVDSALATMITVYSGHGHLNAGAGLPTLPMVVPPLVGSAKARTS